jgi:hypothetical protein
MLRAWRSDTILILIRINLKLIQARCARTTWTGESGVSKGRSARLIHDESPRAARRVGPGPPRVATAAAAQGQNYPGDIDTRNLPG